MRIIRPSPSLIELAFGSLCHQLDKDFEVMCGIVRAGRGFGMVLH